MKKIIFVLTSFLLLQFSFVPNVLAQESSPSGEPVPVIETPVVQDEYSQARVISVEDSTQTGFGIEQPLQKVKLQITTGSEKGKEVEVEHGGLFAIQEEQKVKMGETVVVVKTAGPTGEIYYITDKYRINPLIILTAIFLGLVIFLGRMKGLSSIAGLFLSIVILVKFVVPQIFAGQDPLIISLCGALAIAILSLYLAHGFNKRTSIALGSTIITLLIATIIAILYVKFAGLTGTGSEEAIFLRMGPIGMIDLRGLLLGGIIIGALGVLDDITTSQSAVIDEIRKANPKLSVKELFNRGISVGREHIASLVNTLALAYVGASFPLLLLFSIGENVPLWLTLNSEFIAEELVRTLVGSTALILAVPISTFLAAYFLSREKVVVKATKKRKTS